MKSAKQFVPLLAAVLILSLLFRFGLPGLPGHGPLLKSVPMFLGSDNLLNLAEQISINAILAFGMTLTILIGGIDLSVGAVVALVGVVVVSVLQTPALSEHSAARLPLALAAGFAAAALLGGVNGLCAAKTKMPPFIITLATMRVARGIALGFNEARPIFIPDDQVTFLALGSGRLFGRVPIPAIVMLVLFLLTAILLHRTRFGQHLYAIGGNREAARLTGIPLVRTEFLVYVICALLAGVAGMINAAQLASAEPSSGIGFELDAIAAAVVGGTSFTGGRGTMFGALLGAIIIGILSKGLNQAGVHFSYQEIIKGLVILAAVYIDVRRRK